MKNLLVSKRLVLIIAAISICLLGAACLYYHYYQNGLIDPKESFTKNYQSVYSHFKELTASGKLRRGSFKFSLFKEISFIRYLPFQLIAFFKNFASCNFWLSLLHISSLLVFFAIFGIPIYSKNIPIIFTPLLGFINLVIVFVFLLFSHAKYSFSLFFLTAIVTSALLVLLRLLINKDCYWLQLKQVFNDKENFILPAILFLIGLFIISGHLAHLDIPRSYDHMSYTTLSSLLKIERTYPKFNIYGFPSVVNCKVPPGWIVMVSFISELLNITVARTQLMLVMTFFPFLGMGVYCICRYVFKDSTWAFCAGILALSMRMSSCSPADGDMPEVLEWALVALALFAIYAYLERKDNRFLIFSILAFFVSVIVHVKLALYTFGAFLFSVPFILFKHGLKETTKTIILYLLIMGSAYLLVLPYILSMHGGYSLISSQVRLDVIEFFENMIFRHGYPMIFLVTAGIPFFIKSKNRAIIFCFSYFLMFLIYFDQWLLWDLIKPSWYAKELEGTVNFFGSTGRYTTFFKFISSYSQIFSGFNIVLPILFIYAAYSIIPKRYLKIARAVFILFLIYESGIRPEVPVQLIGKADFQTAKWVRENTDKDTAFIANLGSTNYYLWNISGITERKCLSYRSLKLYFLEGDPFANLNFEDMLGENPKEAIALLKKYRFTHLLISEDSKLTDRDFPELPKVYQCESNGKISRVYSIN